MVNCLKTQLKGAVSSDLLKYGEIRTNVNTDAQRHVLVTNAKVYVDGVDSGTQVTLAAGQYEISVFDKYDITEINANIPFDLQNFNYATELEVIRSTYDNIYVMPVTGDIAYLSKCSALNQLEISGPSGDLESLANLNIQKITMASATNCYGSFAVAFGNHTNLQSCTIICPSMNGTLQDFVKKQILKGRESPSEYISLGRLNQTQVTWNGSGTPPQYTVLRWSKTGTNTYDVVVAERDAPQTAVFSGTYNKSNDSWT